MGSLTLSFQELYEGYAADVRRFALYLSGDAALADDVTSETFIRAWTSPTRIRAESVKAYLLTIARNTYLQFIRAERTRAELDEDVPDQAPDPHATAGRREELSRVLRALHQLPEVDRSALIMRTMDELPYREIAQSLGLTSQAARVKVHRSRLALARIRDGSTKEVHPCR